MESENKMVILIVEDDMADQKLVKYALSSCGVRCDIHCCESGEHALDYLINSRSGIPQNPSPDIILLDLNMPGMGGKEFLRQIKANESYCAIPVVILTTSGSETDIEYCYKLNASGYIQKPTSPTEFQETVGKFTKYWSLTSLVTRK